MFLFLIPVLLLTSNVHSIEHFTLGPRPSAASEAQIRFAEENKYDDTGPGAKGPQYAYNTHKTLEDALVGYINDPDTKLPEREEAKALQKLLKLKHEDKINYNYVTTEQNKPVQRLVILSSDTNNVFNPEKNLASVPNVQRDRTGYVPNRAHRFQTAKGSPVGLAHFARDPVIDTKEFDPNPSYSYSYGVHLDKWSGPESQIELQLPSSQPRKKNPLSSPPRKRNIADYREILKIIKAAKKNVDEQEEKDVFDTYGAYIAAELRNIKDEKVLAQAKCQINNILSQISMGQYNAREYQTGVQETVAQENGKQNVGLQETSIDEAEAESFAIINLLNYFSEQI